MNALLTFLALLLSVGVLIVAPEEGGAALLLCAILSAITALFIRNAGVNKVYLLRLFIAGVLIRVLIGTIIYTFKLQDFFGGDAFTYDFFGYSLYRVWQGDHYYQSLVNQFMGGAGESAWGMLYVVAAIYKVIGRNMLAIQFFNAVLGAATAPLIYLCAQHLFSNIKVARVAGLFVAFYPSLILWSSQGLKDGPIVFVLAISILATLKLGEKFSVKYLIVLGCSLFALLSLRFYIFYMMVAAIGGAFAIGMRPATAQNFIRQFVVIILIGLSMTYFGVTRYASAQFGAYGTLEALQRARLDSAGRAGSGFGSDVDVSTTSGALSVLPTGVIYLLFAPFPWQLASLRQSITLPEMVVWWVSFPLLMLGLWFAIKYRLRQVSPILIFSSMLTLAYSLFQGNVGTAYRQRSQLLIFYFIFVAVGLVLLQEKRKESRQQREAERERLRAGRKRVGPAPPEERKPHPWKAADEVVEREKEDESGDKSMKEGGREGDSAASNSDQES